MCSEKRLREVATDHSNVYELSGVYEGNVMLLGNNKESLEGSLRDVRTLGLCELQGNHATCLNWNPSKNQTGRDIVIGVQPDVTRKVGYSHVETEEPTRVEGGPADKVFDPGGGATMTREISLLRDAQYLDEPGLVRCYAIIGYDVRGHLPAGNNHIHQIVVVDGTINCCGGILVVGDIKVGGIANNISLSTLMSGNRGLSAASMYTDRLHVRIEVIRKEGGVDVTTEEGPQTATVILLKVLCEILVSKFDSCEVSCLRGGGANEFNGDGAIESTFISNEEISFEAKMLALIRAMFDPGGRVARDINEADTSGVVVGVPRLHDELVERPTSGAWVDTSNLYELEGTKTA